MMFLSKTDLPVPDGPRMAVMRPLGTSKVMSERTVCDPKDLVTPFREMMVSDFSDLPLGALRPSPSDLPSPSGFLPLPRAWRLRPFSLTGSGPFPRRHPGYWKRTHKFDVYFFGAFLAAGAAIRETVGAVR